MTNADGARQSSVDPPAGVAEQTDSVVAQEETPSETTMQLWNEVAHGIDKNQTVVWQNAVNSLEYGLQYLQDSNEARRFIEKYMKPVISILLEQHPQKTGMVERDCVETSLKYALQIIEDDIKSKTLNNDNEQSISSDEIAEESKVLDVLALLFNKKKLYYKGSKMSGWNNNMNGLPDVRNGLVLKFRSQGMFGTLASYLNTRAGKAAFPDLETVREILIATCDALPKQRSKEFSENPSLRIALENELIAVSKAVMKHLDSASEEYLKKQSNMHINSVRFSLQNIFYSLFETRSKETFAFYAFCRGFAYKLISSQSLPLKLFGWEMITDLIEAAQAEFSPPPKCFVISQAGTPFVNGVYKFAANLTSDGYVAPRADIRYENDFKLDRRDGNGRQKRKIITLFRCTMRSQQKWWFLSEADENQPGTDKDIDYYQHKSKKDEEDKPPSTGWTTCREGADPPPFLEARGIMVPDGEEFNTMEHQLAKWAISNKIVEIVLGSSIHREIVARSIELIRFLACMISKEENETGNGVDQNDFSLQASHLTLAWNTCKSKLDPAVSAEVYNLLVSILPDLPNRLAIHLIVTIQESLANMKGSDHLYEVAEFCSTLANGFPDANDNEYICLSDEVRPHVLNLLWNVLVHPGAHKLKCYDNLKLYVSQELRIEPMGKTQRQSFLTSCKEALLKNSSQRQTDETAALRIVNLTQFVLETMPQDQVTHSIFAGQGELAKLIFDELMSYLKRLSYSKRQISTRQSSSNSMNCSNEFCHALALSERLGVIRYVYGISGTIEMTSRQLESLWNMCTSTEDREAIMIFLANASSNETSTYGPNENFSNKTVRPLTPSYSNDVQLYAFQSLFCCEAIDWENLGPKAYRSYQILFKATESLNQSFASFRGPALDALWRICLHAGNDDVANQAMKDLLFLYSSIRASKREHEAASKNAWAKKVTPMEKIPDKLESFANKIYSYLENVREGLRNNDKMSRRSAERCMRILNSALVYTDGDVRGSSSSTIHFKPSSLNGKIMDVKDVISKFPHGMRGQVCYRTISVLAKRASSGQKPATERFCLQVHPLESLSSVNRKVAVACHHDSRLVKPISFNNNRSNLNIEPDTSIVDDLGIVEGSEVVFLLCSNVLPQHQNSKTVRQTSNISGLTMADIFGTGSEGPSDQCFETLLDILELLPPVNQTAKCEASETSRLVWKLLQSVPTNKGTMDKVRLVSQCKIIALNEKDKAADNIIENEMVVDIKKNDSEWDKLFDLKHYQKAVYVLEVIDSFLQPSVELLEQIDKKRVIVTAIENDAQSFRQSFIDSGGFDALIRFFTRTKSFEGNSSIFRRENEYIFRIIKCCLFRRESSICYQNNKPMHQRREDNLGTNLLHSLKDSNQFFSNLASSIVLDNGVSTSAVMNALLILQSLFSSDIKCSSNFASIPNNLAENFVISLLLWETKASFNAVTMETCRFIRMSTKELILTNSSFSSCSLSWLIKALDNIDYNADASEEYFSLLIRLVELDKEIEKDRIKIPQSDLSCLSTTLCKKLAQCPRPTTSSIDISTGVLCGCLKLLNAVIHNGATSSLADGVWLLMHQMNAIPWSGTSQQQQNDDNTTLVNLIGIIFDAFLSDGMSPLDLALCADEKSRRIAFDVLLSCVGECKSDDCHIALSSKIQNMIASSAPFLRHRWGHNASFDELGTVNASTNHSYYSGLKNQGCTCYMNSVLQQLFMMPELRKNLCSAILPSSLRSAGCTSASGYVDLVGKCITMQWENGSSFDAIVESYNEKTDMHRIRYLIPKYTGNTLIPEQSLQNPAYDFSDLTQELPDEFVLSQGRPDKETGIFDIVPQNDKINGTMETSSISSGAISTDKLKETADEAAYRKLLEEVQKTFVHLDKGSRGRVFDPRSLVESSGCLKLEFDIWQQNDASEFAMKLLDKLEVPLKRWSPVHFKYLEHTFRLKQTKQKLCKECGLKTNREENLMNIDCQIRGKSDIHEALSTMCEVEYMEGDNKVFCDNCKKNCDTILRTAISALPDVLILSLKRFDLDYNTFETVKLNSRCAFEQNLNMKKYTLEGVEAMEKASLDDNEEPFIDPLSTLPDEDYEYRLAGVLVHHGVAQGGHYYSFIRDRTKPNTAEADKWFRFDDDEVTPFDPSQIEVECFGGKVKKETKWPNGQINTVETEQLANALMLFYEKVKPSPQKTPEEEKEIAMDESEDIISDITFTTGMEIFEGDVKKSNSVHRSHAFLFDTEFQRFLRKLLDVVIVDDVQSTKLEESSIPTWRIAILELATLYFFDVLLHSVNNTTLNDWTNILSSVLATSGICSRWFVKELAKRTRSVNENWLRIFASDCPEKHSRRSAMKVIASALRCCAGHPAEVTMLKSWSQAWIQQLENGWSFDSDYIAKLPVSLIGDNQHLEDLTGMVGHGSSCVGIVISFICLLLDLAPRTWQYNSDLCFLLREIGSIRIEDGGEAMREALNASQIPARLIAILLRDKAPLKIRSALPGASMSLELAEAISKPISSPTAHIFPMNNSTGNVAVSTPLPSDHIYTLEAIAAIIGIEGAKNADLVFESEEVKGRPTYELTNEAKISLTTIFNECTSNQGLMVKQGFDDYLKACATSVSVSPQQLMSKYGNEYSNLTIDGFLSYYRDISQTSPLQLRNDLQTYGFRPDLTRCSLKSRVSNVEDRSLSLSPIESIAIDVCSMKKSQNLLGPLAEAGFLSLHLYHLIYFTNSHLTEYLVAWYGFNKSTDKLLTETLKSLYHAHTQSCGNEVVQVCTMILMVLAALPDDRQKQRITTIMQSQDNLNVRGNVGCGLLSVAKELSIVQSAHQYSADYHNHQSMLDRYIDVIQDLRNVQAVSQWMAENKSLCEWVDQVLRAESNDYQNNGEFLGRSERSRNASGTLYNNTQSDSDINGDFGSDESDGYDESSLGCVIVKGAGVEAINGVYIASNKRCDKVAKFTKTALHEGKRQEFTLFRCQLQDKTRRWYISIVPPHAKPGTNQDIDYYFCASNGLPTEVPHGCIWITAPDYGKDPEPTTEWRGQDTFSDENEDQRLDEDNTDNFDDALMEEDTQQ